MCAFKSFLTDTLGVNNDAEMVHIDSAKRIKNTKGNSKPVIVTFVTTSDRNRIMDKMREIKPQNIYAKSDLPKDVRETRRKLAKFYESAVNQKRKLRVVWDKLEVDKLGRSVVQWLVSWIVSPLVGVRSPAMAVVFSSSPTADGGFLRVLRFTPSMKERQLAVPSLPSDLMKASMWNPM